MLSPFSEAIIFQGLDMYSETTIMLTYIKLMFIYMKS